jgi:HK97 gp10 family phage protein
MDSELIGLREANAALRRLPAFAQVRAQAEMDVTAFQVANRARARAPEATGVLRRAIQWASRPRSVSAVVGVTTDSLFARFDAFYWKFVEYGTVKMPARPSCVPRRKPCVRITNGD